MTQHEKLIMRLAIGQLSRSQSDARICRECNRVVDGDESEHCGKRTWEFRSKYLQRFPRRAPKTKLAVPEHVINREYPYHPHVVFGARRGKRCRYFDLNSHVLLPQC